MGRDYKVRTRDRESIASIAMDCWKLATKQGKSFNICEFLRNTLANRFRDGIVVVLHSFVDLPEKAYVSFNPTALHIVDAIWADANIGREYARHIVAHEIGHLVLHSNQYVAIQQQELAYSQGQLDPYRYIQREDSCECQANDFADLFLVPDHIAIDARSAETLALTSLVTDDLAARRISEAKSARKILRPSYEGDMCLECSNFTLVRIGLTTKCDTCGDRKQD